MGGPTTDELWAAASGVAVPGMAARPAKMVPATTFTKAGAAAGALCSAAPGIVAGTPESATASSCVEVGTVADVLLVAVSATPAAVGAVEIPS